MNGPPQIQSWPTPQIFIRRAGARRLQEWPLGRFALDGFIYAQQITESQSEAAIPATFALDAYLVPGPLKRSVSDAPKASFALGQMIHRVIVLESDTDSANASFALADFDNPTAELQSAAETEATALFALSSMVINP